ncbi:MAG: glycosyltransferase family 2 protein [Armatimonadota bacterium]|nr:glycosyltransferase family 2 protein [Armatimonadota bacterium]
MDLGGLSVVLPAFNEAGNLEATVRELAPEVAAAAADVEIVVVDDGSTDATAAVAERLAAELPVRVLRHDRNRGYGAALRTGFGAARHPWILLLDADGQFLPAELDRFLPLAREADLVIGYRVRRADPRHRGSLAAVWRWLMRALLDVQVRDVDCAFKLMRTAVVQALALESAGAFISAELLGKARRYGARIAEVPVSHRPRRHGRQTGGSLRVLLRAFYELARLWWRVRRFSPDAATGPTG